MNYNFHYDIPIEIDSLLNIILDDFDNLNFNDSNDSNDSNDFVNIHNDDIHNIIENNNFFNNKSEINQLLGKSIFINKNDNHYLDECIICLDSLNYKQYKRILPYCNHFFHKKCIDKWFLKNSCCPICRYNYK